MKNNLGVSLIELMIAVFMVSLAVSMISLLFPKTSANIVHNRQNMTGSNLAMSKIIDIKSHVYGSIDLTPASNPPFLSTGDPGCDCSTVKNFAALPPVTGTTATIEVIPSTGTTYTRYTCINYVTFAVGGARQAHCPANEKDAKYIRVWVSWPSGSDTRTIDQESIVSRY